MRFFAVFSLLLLLGGCRIKWFTPYQVEAQLSRLAPHHYAYADEDFALALKIGPGKKVSWEFRNKYETILSLHYQSVYLYDGEGNRYNLWGEDFAETPLGSLLHVNPHSFMALSYPLRFQSLFLPWRPDDGRLALRVEAQWQNFKRSYLFSFPPPEKDDSP